ncbi:hypothetical protein BDN72DRAFT_905249 [Pluteus cervinus]|uniref:Uncharacterized protein n=1 Tax=Pluteus cervinus TaxID=181527 RepID=A0ACD3A392_9AGAR|nr:hypothetical protein BDN72DRAFT_905249 [Pluteus cervinus]
MTLIRRRHRSGPGAEQGVDFRTTSARERYASCQQACIIDVVDYSRDSFQVTRMNNTDFIRLLGSEPQPQPSEKKLVRWINIGGIDAKVLSALAEKYHLHALALEDVLHGNGDTHSKADYYQAHLFLCLSTLQLLSPDDEEALYRPPTSVDSSTDTLLNLQAGSGATLLPTNGHHVDMFTATKVRGNSSQSVRDRIRNLGRRLTLHHGHETPETRDVRIRALTKGDRVPILTEPMFVFVLRDGTVISIYPRPTLELTEPIKKRLEQKDSVLRLNEDSSILVESLLDLGQEMVSLPGRDLTSIYAVVDRVLELTDIYQAQIQQLEHDTLLHAGVKIIRRLHILSADVIIHKRRLEPMKTLIQRICRHDDEGAQNGALNVPPGTATTNGGMSTAGYFSSEARMYLADVQDHVDFALSSLDMFSAISENLLNYAFNMASYQMNQYMRRLTIITIIFLPLTLLSGYFGMNFEHFTAVSTHSDLYFWEVALPTTIVLVPLFIWPDLTRGFGKLQGMLDAHRAVKRYHTYQPRI